MISIKDYAKNKGVSYEAVRKQVNRYKDELGEHIQRVNRTQYLDDAAVDFLDQKRASSPVIIVESAKDEQIEQLQAENRQLQQENRALLLKITDLQDALLKDKDKISQLEGDKIKLLESKVKKKHWWNRRKKVEVEQ